MIENMYVDWICFHILQRKMLFLMTQCSSNFPTTKAETFLHENCYDNSKTRNKGQI